MLLFPDTNFFIECRDPRECPWAEISSDSQITLVICRQVRSEIDHLKSSSRGRQSSRAREWASKFREASRAGGRLELRRENPALSLWIPPPVAALSSLPNVLDPHRPDDRVIADVLAHLNANSEMADAAFFTDDGGAADTARHIGLNVVDIPEDDEAAPKWRLASEADPTEKKIRLLEQQLSALQKQSPSIQIDVINPTGDPIEAVPIQIVHFKALESAAVAQLVETIRARNPIELDNETISSLGQSTAGLDTLTGALTRSYMHVQKQLKLQKYLHDDYPSWLERVEKFFSTLHVLLSLPSQYVSVTIQVQNAGTIPAENVILRLEALGGIHLLQPPKEDDRDAVIRYTPPSAPAVPSVEHLISGGLASPDVWSRMPASVITQPMKRDEFYWREKNSKVSWEAECLELRHQDTPKKLHFIIRADHTNSIASAAIRCTLSASNLPRPETLTFKVPIAAVEGDTGAYAIDILHRPRPLRVQLGRMALPPHPDPSFVDWRPTK